VIWDFGVLGSVVVTGVLHLQSMAQGTYGGPTLLMLSANPFDSSIGITAAIMAIRPRSGEGARLQGWPNPPCS
jgi:hypothetical protein